MGHKGKCCYTIAIISLALLPKDFSLWFMTTSAVFFQINSWVVLAILSLATRVPLTGLNVLILSEVT